MTLRQTPITLQCACVLGRRRISYHIIDLKQQNRLKVGTDKPKLKVKMQSVSDDVRKKKLLEKPRFELALTVKGAFRPGRSYIFGQGVSRSLGQRPGKN